MRVTKNIREYIEKSVTEKIEPRYAAEKAEAQGNIEALETFFKGCAAAAEAAYNQYFDEHFDAISDIAEDLRSKDYSPLSFYNSRTARLTNRHSSDSVYYWRERMRSDVNREVSNIVVTLELGGTRKELDEMLAAI